MKLQKITPCSLKWSDGWSAEHRCTKPTGHIGDHLCQCDGRISQWMAEHGDDELLEDAEEARIRLRKELLALQEEESSP